LIGDAGAIGRALDETVAVAEDPIHLGDDGGIGHAAVDAEGDGERGLIGKLDERDLAEGQNAAEQIATARKGGDAADDQESRTQACRAGEPGSVKRICRCVDPTVG
jgi:hypothetical protein